MDYCFTETRRIVEEIFGAAIPRSVLKNWYYGHKKHRMTRLNALDKSLWYRKAYELVLKLKKEKPYWGHKKISAELRRHLPIRVPPLTVYFWTTGRSKPIITPIKICPELGYLVGVLVGDYERSAIQGRLRVKDRKFAEYFAAMYKKVTGNNCNIYLEDSSFYRTSKGGAFLRTLWITGLWKIIAHIYPIEFLQGLFDSKGCISIKKSASGYILKMSTGDLEVLLVTSKLLRNLGYKTKIRLNPPQTRIIDTRIINFKHSYSLHILGGKKALHKFAAEIGFRESKRNKRLKALLEAYKYPPKERHKILHEFFTPPPPILR